MGREGDAAADVVGFGAGFVDGAGDVDFFQRQGKTEALYKPCEMAGKRYDEDIVAYRQPSANDSNMLRDFHLHSFAEKEVVWMELWE